MRNSEKRDLRPWAIMVFLCLFYATGLGQDTCKNAGISRASIYEGQIAFHGGQYDGYIQLTLDKGVTDADHLDDTSLWTVIGVSPGTNVKLPAIVKIELKSPLTPNSPNKNAPTFFINAYYQGNFIVAKTYLIYIDRMTFDGCKPGKEVFASMTKKSPPAHAPENTPYGLGKAADRASSDLYVSGTIEGVSHDKAVKNIDLKLSIPIAVKVFPNGNYLTPYIDLKTSSNKKADADSLNIGVVLTSSTGIRKTGINKKGYFRSLVWDLDGHLEGNKNLRFINGVISNKFYFTTKEIALCKTSCSLYIQPFLGFEVGHNMRTPVSQARDQTIARPIFGATAYLNFDIKKPLLDTVSIQTDYTRRWSLTSEVGVDIKDAKYIPVFAGRGPRDYLENKVEFGFNDYFGFTIGYEYGSLPPNFNLLDHKFSVGLTYKSLLTKRPK